MSCYNRGKNTHPGRQRDLWLQMAMVVAGVPGGNPPSSTRLKQGTLPVIHNVPTGTINNQIAIKIITFILMYTLSLSFTFNIYWYSSYLSPMHFLGFNVMPRRIPSLFQILFIPGIPCHLLDQE